MKYICWCIFAIALITVISGCTPQSSDEEQVSPVPEATINKDTNTAQNPTDASALFNEKCSRCHSVADIFEKSDDCASCHKTGQMSEGKVASVNWTELVKEMQSKKADWISDAEATSIAGWLEAGHNPQ